MEILPDLNVSKKALKGLLQDSKKSAEIINLLYVSDKMPGITRARRGRNFVYFKNEKRLSDQSELARIKKLVIPPAWENVWICPLPTGHLQATGFDIKGRKQ